MLVRSRATLLEVASRATLVLAMVLVLAPRASAQDASDSVAARALFQEGVELSDAGSWAAAIDRFRRALALRDSAVIAYNLGVALAHEGHPVEAAERFRRVVRDEEADDALRAEARAALEAAEATIAWVVTTWDGDAESATLRVDGAERPIALFGTGMPVDPGAHEVMLVRDGNEIAIGSFTIAAGERTTLALTTLEIPVVAPAPVDDVEMLGDPSEGGASDAGGGTTDPVPFIAIGVGAGVLVVAGVIVLAVVLTPLPEAMPYSGSLGSVELGR